METLRQLVAGTDFSEGSEPALEMAIKLALAASVRLTLVHVCDQGGDDEDQRLAQCSEALRRLVVRQRRRGLDVTGVLRSGNPSEKLDNVAAEVGASLIVVGRHGAGRGPRIEIGSVAERLVRTASRPVLTVAHDFATSLL